MAGAGTLLCKKISDITGCSICVETLKEPKVLPCGHTFCLQCIETYHQNKKPEEEVNCALCRQAFNVPVGGFKKLPNNFCVIQLLQLNQLPASQSTDKHVDCEWCSNGATSSLTSSASASVYCIECGHNICEPCAETHKKLKLAKDHRVVSLKDKPSEEELREMAPCYCEQHPNKELEFYCRDCKTSTCVVCYVEHRLKKHNCCDAKELATELHAKLKEDMEKVMSSILESRDELKEIEQYKQYFIYRLTTTKVEMSKKYSELRSLLELHEKRQLAELDLFNEKILNEFEKRKVVVDTQVVMMESFKKHCKEITGCKKLCDFSSAVDDSHARVDDFVKSRQESVKTRLVAPEITFTPSRTTIDDVDNWIGKLVLEGYYLLFAVRYYYIFVHNSRQMLQYILLLSCTIINLLCMFKLFCVLKFIL